ncbi:hypothetical protein KSS87_001957 [Heliosperma pusillum]|nr:hypothetical protein KSS87_001957 [Heliosperma pusillum]
MIILIYKKWSFSMKKIENYDITRIVCSGSSTSAQMFYQSTTLAINLLIYNLFIYKMYTLIITH